MIAFVEWEHPIRPKNPVPKFGNTELILENYRHPDRMRAHVHTLKKIRQAGRFRIHLLDIMTEKDKMRMVPLQPLLDLISAARERIETEEDHDLIQEAIEELQPFIDMFWLDEVRAIEAAEEEAARQKAIEAAEIKKIQQGILPEAKTD